MAIAFVFWLRITYAVIMGGSEAKSFVVDLVTIFPQEHKTFSSLNLTRFIKIASGTDAL